MDLPVMPPLAPMLAKAVARVPAGNYGYEPKWDGFRTIVFRDGDEVEIASRNGRAMNRYFPELEEAFRRLLPERCVVDGEIVLIDDAARRLDFDTLQQRIHPAASRVRKLAAETPAAFVGFDLLALGDRSLLAEPYERRRALLAETFAQLPPPLYLTAETRDRAVAEEWFASFEGAGLDGVLAKALDEPYEPGRRTMLKIKHERTADCVLAGYRTHKNDPKAIGSLLLGLFDDDGALVHVGVASSFPMPRRRKLFEELQPLVTDAAGHPWAPAEQQSGTRTPRNAEGSRWSGDKDLSFTFLRPERVVEVKYDHMEGERFRHTAQFQRWRPDRDPGSCTYAQLEEPVRYDLDDVLSTGGS